MSNRKKILLCILAILSVLVTTLMLYLELQNQKEILVAYSDWSIPSIIGMISVVFTLCIVIRLVDEYHTVKLQTIYYIFFEIGTAFNLLAYVAVICFSNPPLSNSSYILFGIVISIPSLLVLASKKIFKISLESTTTPEIIDFEE